MAKDKSSNQTRAMCMHVSHDWDLERVSCQHMLVNLTKRFPHLWLHKDLVMYL